MPSDNTLEFGSLCIHAAQEPDPQTGAVCVPINLATTYAQTTPGKHKGFEYSRSGNPTRNTLEECIASLENGKFGFAFASGSSATMTIVNLLDSGDNIICADDVYGGTNRYLSKVASRSNAVSVTYVDFTKENAFKNAISEKTKMVWIESPTNPTLKLIDIKKIAKIAKENNILVVVDNTFATPYFQSPLSLGADIVSHSATKYINGHSDIVMGLVVTNDLELGQRIRFLQNSIGSVPGVFDCYMVLRGIKTLHLRMKQHERNAFAVAKYLEKHDKVKRVIYPGLKSHPQYDLAVEQMTGFGGMVTVVLKGGLKEANKFLSSLKLFVIAESLGAVESLAELPSIMTHLAVPHKQREILGINDSLVRLSVGIEDQNDILNDIKQALNAIENFHKDNNCF